MICQVGYACARIGFSTSANTFDAEVASAASCFANTGLMYECAIS